MQEETVRAKDTEIDIMELVHVIWKRIWMVLLCAAVGATAWGCHTKFFTTPRYSASSTIYVLSQRISSVNLSLSAQLTADFAILAKSRPVIENVINELDLDMEYESLVGCISVQNPEESQILKFVVTHPDPVFARDVANAMADSVAARIAEVMAMDKPNIVEEAVLPKAPVGSGVTRSIVLGGLLGGVAAIALILILYLLDDTIHHEDDVKKYLGLNTLAAFPEMGAVKKKKRYLKA